MGKSRMAHCQAVNVSHAGAYEGGPGGLQQRRAGAAAMRGAGAAGAAERLCGGGGRGPGRAGSYVLEAGARSILVWTSGIAAQAVHMMSLSAAERLCGRGGGGPGWAGRRILEAGAVRASRPSFKVSLSKGW